MAIKRGSKVDMNSSSASMTDLMFLLLIFLMIATTLINSNALKINLPKGTAPNADKTIVTVSLNSSLQWYLEDQPVQFSELESLLPAKLEGMPEPRISFYGDKTVPLDQVVKIMNLANRNNAKLNLATAPE